MRAAWTTKGLYMSPTFITNKRQKVHAVLFNPRPSAEHGHTRVFDIVLIRIGEIWQRRRCPHTCGFDWQQGCRAHSRDCELGEYGYACCVLVSGIGVVAYVLGYVVKAGNIWCCVSGEACCRLGCRQWAGAGAATAVYFRQGGFKHGPTRIPVLEGEGVPVGPTGPRHTWVAGGVAGGDVLAEADPVVRGEILGDDVSVVRVHSRQIFETDLTGCERLKSTELNSREIHCVFLLTV